MQKKTNEILKFIETSAPDLIIVSDDNAIKYIVEPHLKSGSIPVIFCGVNWTAAPYGLPTENITGMLEILPVKEGIDLAIKFFPGIKNITIISENSLSELKNIQHITGILERSGYNVAYHLADTFEEWQLFFRQANSNRDLIYLPTNGAIRNWDDKEAISFIKENIKRPVVTCDDFMMPFSVFGVTKIQKEQGIWAGKTALKVLSGTSVSNIPLSRNSEIEIRYNPVLGEIIGVDPDSSDTQNFILYSYNF
jgi:ABC-type uncharacterized transport system substrate-binding protein